MSLANTQCLSNRERLDAPTRAKPALWENSDANFAVTAQNALVKHFAAQLSIWGERGRYSGETSIALETNAIGRRSDEAVTD
jgi:hypothetical protein